MPPDPEMAAGLLAVADRVAALTRAGRAKLEVEIRSDEGWLRRAESAGRAGAAMAGIRGNLTCRRIVRERFALWADFEAFLRRAAAFFRSGGPYIGATRLSGEFAMIGHRLNAIGRRCSEAMAGR
jgi:hypothetical protein